MKLFSFISVLVVFSILFMISCEEESNDSVGGYVFSDIGIVRFLNDSYDSSVIKIIELVSGDHLYIRNNTLIYVLRPSGSGYSLSDIGEIDIGDIIEYFYYMEDRDFESDPGIIYPIKIYLN